MKCYPESSREKPPSLQIQTADIEVAIMFFRAGILAVQIADAFLAQLLIVDPSTHVHAESVGQGSRRCPPC